MDLQEKNNEQNNLEKNETEITSSKKKNLLKWPLLLLVVFSLGGLTSYKFMENKIKKTASPLFASSEEVANINAAAIAKDSVVSVVGYSDVSTTLQARLFGNSNVDSSKIKDGMRAVANGSGVIYKKNLGSAYIVTNNHVIDGVKKIEIILSDGSNIEAEIVGKDLWTDLAVLKISSANVKSVMEFADSDKVVVGQDSLAIGSPLGATLSNTVTKGIISATERQVPMDIDSDGTSDWYQTVIQTDTAINPGNSGGALINSSGQLIGINQLKISNVTSSVSAEGIGFVIPSNEVKLITEQLEKNGSVKRPALGLQLISLSTLNSQTVKEELNYDASKQGVIVRNVEKDSAAERAGLKEMDIITKINNTEIKSVAELRKYLFEKTKVGDTVNLSYYRNGNENSIQLVLGELKSTN
ncbi:MULTISPECIES: S1C family serine protease [unclassified Gemella]|uniref:S1C family serine protease n=1 Tax=unclassified Gemella TaxID=2624949 RepID=UPI0010737B04|nr:MULTISPECIES: trypsin-like peptidase domain-containing protein [unclassified Gemella]MBF0709806.1 trypsin-like peptidase domain-containing protein [Gemella sp. GL1.1]MBF0747106.1 trypsin-like peptidase domain-containing protein [Gemella sp. 19428wG2_WT2a]NYS27150.1 trypsin-like peptidase domain-containing protein [Gemella sp. GL1]TFU58349.1 PDZ domain-containing protein [Gemella sp. WT2a]